MAFKKNRGLRDSEIDSLEDLLAAEFGWTDDTRATFRDSMNRMTEADLTEDRALFEFIVDSPVTANWRLKINRDTGWFRLADYGQWENPERQRKVARINEALNQIRVPR